MVAGNRIYYQPGQLIKTPDHADIAGASAFSSTTTAAWHDITANAKTLEIVYTPPVDCRIEITLTTNAWHSVANALWYIGIEINGGIVRSSPGGGGSIAGATGAVGQTLVFETGLPSDVAYTITGQYYLSTAGTLYISQLVTQTELYIKLTANP
jgi:hypothetical protein